MFQKPTKSVSSTPDKKQQAHQNGVSKNACIELGTCFIFVLFSRYT